MCCCICATIKTPKTFNSRLCSSKKWSLYLHLITWVADFHCAEFERQVRSQCLNSSDESNYWSLPRRWYKDCEKSLNTLQHICDIISNDSGDMKLKDNALINRLYGHCLVVALTSVSAASSLNSSTSVLEGVLALCMSDFKVIILG